MNDTFYEETLKSKTKLEYKSFPRMSLSSHTYESSCMKTHCQSFPMVRGGFFAQTIFLIFRFSDKRNEWKHQMSVEKKERTINALLAQYFLFSYLCCLFTWLPSYPSEFHFSFASSERSFFVDGSTHPQASISSSSIQKKNSSTMSKGRG